VFESKNLETLNVSSYNEQQIVTEISLHIVLHGHASNI
jgi:hypothetical protein